MHISEVFGKHCLKTDHLFGSLDSMERGTVEWNSETVEWWNGGIVEWWAGLAY